jgi:hypothetical protein
LPHAAGEGVPAIVPPENFDSSGPDDRSKPDLRPFQRLASDVAHDAPTTISPRTENREGIAFRFNGYVMGSIFFVREIFSVRPFRSMPSHVRHSYMAVRSKPVCMARSSSGSWSIHSGFDRIASRSGKNASIPDRDEPHYCIEPVASVPTRTGRGSVQHCDCLLASV